MPKDRAASVEHRNPELFACRIKDIGQISVGKFRGRLNGAGIDPVMPLTDRFIFALL